jgi:hypothetical protein
MSTRAQPWIVSGDVDGFFGIAVDNLIQFLLILALCTAVLGFSSELVIGTILPGAALSISSATSTTRSRRRSCRLVRDEAT